MSWMELVELVPVLVLVLLVLAPQVLVPLR
jgi:hypothetical protein